jgi:outer membrane protein assembly factor BamB
VLALATTATASERAELEPVDAPATNASVSAIARAGDRIVVGGNFTHIGARTGPLARIDATDGALRARLPAVAGVVDAMASDGAGGVYIGGGFEEVGGVPRRGLAHVLASGAVDPRFRADVHSSSSVYPVSALAYDQGRLYVGGKFDNLSGASRVDLGAVDGTTGAAVPGFDAPIVGGGVESLAVGAGRLYVGGSFFRVGDADRRNLVAFDLATGMVDRGFDPVAASTAPPAEGEQRAADADGSVDALTLGDGRLYIGGRFTAIAGRSRARLAALDPATGRLDEGFDPGSDEPVGRLVLDGERLYVSYSADRSTPGDLDGLFAVHVATGAVDPTFAPEVRGPVLHVGARVYVRGEEGVVALERSGRTDPDFDGTAASGPVRALVLAANGLYVGGDFAAIGARRSPRLAAFDADTGAVDATWGVDVDGGVRDLVPGGRVLYVHGSFTRIGGVARHGLAAISGRTGRLVERFRPPRILGVKRVVVGRKHVYVLAGRAGGRRQSGVFVLDRRTGRLARRLRLVARTRAGRRSGRGYLQDILKRGRRLYVAGSFTHLNGRPRSSLGAIDVRTGRLVRSFRPRLREERRDRPYVESLSARGRGLYVLGSFVSASGRPRTNFARLQLRTGAVDRRFRPPETSYARGANVTFSERHVYLAEENLLAELDRRSGAVRRYGDAFGDEFEFIDEMLVAAGRLYAVGSFGPGSRESDIPSRPAGIAAFDVGGTETAPMDPTR